MLFQQTCKCDIPSSSKKKKKPDVETGNCHRANVSGCLLFIAFEFVHSHTHLLGTGASQWGGDHDFHLQPEQQRVGEEKGWCTWCSSGGQMNQMKLQPSCSCAHTSTKGQSQSLLQLVACLEDRWGYGAGPGGPRLPAGTSRLGWYIRSRSQLTCHSREHWDEVERLQRFCVLQMWSSYHESLQRMNKTCQAMYSKTSNWPT